MAQQAASASTTEPAPRKEGGTGMKVKIKSWHAVAVWDWGVNDEVCGICRNPFEACCPNCSLPDDCPPVWGQCTHAFHMHCILQWLDSQADSRTQQCPYCRRDWELMK